MVFARRYQAPRGDVAEDGSARARRILGRRCTCARRRSSAIRLGPMNEEVPRCARCEKPVAYCVCDRVTPQRVRTRVVVLQHPQEQDREIGTAPILRTALPGRCEVRVGLSWASLAHCLGEDEPDARCWGVLYPHSLRKPLPRELLDVPVVVLDRNGEPADDTARLTGVIVLDGTWSQAKALWWRNPWMLKLQRVVLHPKEPSIYGRLRREPRREALSTLEAVAEALVANGEPESVRAELRKVFRTMVQRARDHQRATGAPAPKPED